MKADTSMHNRQAALLALTIIALGGVAGFLVGGINVTLDIVYPGTHHTLVSDVIAALVFMSAGSVAMIFRGLIGKW